MVDLSEKDYAKYLYAKGIIKYIPERLEDYEVVDEYDGYYPKVDIALELKNPRWEILLEEYHNSDDEELNESEEDKFDTSLYPDWKDCEPTYGIVEDVNGKQHQYYLDETGCIFMYKGEDIFYDDGTMDYDSIEHIGIASYLNTNYREWAEQCKIIEENYKNNKL